MKETIELIPREFAEKRQVKRSVAAWIAVGVAALIAVAFSAASLAWRTQAVDAAVAPLREQVAALQPLKMQVQPLSEKLRLNLERQRLTQQLLQEPRWNELIRDISEASAPEIWVESLSMENPLNLTATPAPELPTLRISGTAASDRALLLFMDTFANSPWIESLMMQQSRRADRNAGDGQDTTVEFVLQGRIRFNEGQP